MLQFVRYVLVDEQAIVPKGTDVIETNYVLQARSCGLDEEIISEVRTALERERAQHPPPVKSE